MSRNGATRAPFWMMRIRPPCSRTNRRPLPSLGTSIPVGDARPLTNADRPSAGGPPGGGLTAVLEEPPPQPNNMTSSAGATRRREKTKEGRISSARGCVGIAFLGLRIVCIVMPVGRTPHTIVLAHQFGYRHPYNIETSFSQSSDALSGTLPVISNNLLKCDNCKKEIMGRDKA